MAPPQDDDFDDLDISLGGGDGSAGEEEGSSYNDEEHEAMENQLMSRLNKNLKGAEAPPPAIEKEEEIVDVDASFTNIVITVDEDLPPEASPAVNDKNNNNNKSFETMEQATNPAKPQQHEPRFFMDFDRKQAILWVLLCIILIAGPLAVGWGVALNNDE